MRERGDFCLPPKVLARAPKALILVKLIVFTWGLFTPATPLSVVLILAAIVLLGPAYFVKVFLKYGGEEGTLWTRVAGCVSSVMIALGSLALAWGAGYGMPHYESVGGIAFLGFWILGLVAASFVDTLDSVLKNGQDKNCGHVNR